MCRGCGVEREVDDRDPPPPDVIGEPGFHRIVGEIAKRVIEEVGKDVGEHDEAAEQPHLSNAYPAQPPPNARQLRRAVGANVENG
jgi:hypothetical protein